MNQIAAGLRSGRWLTATRLRVYPRMLLVIYVASIAYGLWTAAGPLDVLGRPLGTDFSQVWVAGLSVLAGHPEQPFDPALHFAAQNAIFGAAAPVYGWHYPPYFLAVAAAVALLPYVPALLAYQGVTLALFAATIWRIIPDRRALLCALAFPAVLVNLGHGNNGFLTASLLGGAMLLLPRRPALAGVLLALLAYKPQFGLVIPLALLVDRRWTTIVAAAATLALMTLATWAAFGAGAWAAFRRSMMFTRIVVLEQGNTGWEKIQSAFAAVRAVGASIAVAYGVQAVVTLVAIGCVLWLWRTGVDWRLKSAALITAALLSTPYVLDYDMVVLGPALAFMVSYALERGFRAWERSLLAFVWMAPILARGAASLTLVPLGLLAMMSFLALIMRRGLTDRPGAMAERREAVTA